MESKTRLSRVQRWSGAVRLSSLLFEYYLHPILRSFTRVGTGLQVLVMGAALIYSLGALAGVIALFPIVEVPTSYSWIFFNWFFFVSLLTMLLRVEVASKSGGTTE